MKISTRAERGRRQGPEDWFTGRAWMEPVAEHAPSNEVQVLYVEFEAGARTHWHTHPIGQVLEVTSGRGWVQVEDQPVQPICVGDVVLIGPNESHWHGACIQEPMTHLAINEWDTEGNNVTWGAAVTDEEYNKAG